MMYRLLLPVLIMGLYSCAYEHTSNQLMATAELAAKPGTEHIDYLGFTQLTNELQAYRQERLIELATFAEMLNEEDAIVLDTRSKAAYDAIHIAGAVHLNFSDFTDDKLAKVIPSKDTKILIYCNNNFSNAGPHLADKRMPLALNIPTFINLYGYGYQNIYELKSYLPLGEAKEHLRFEGTAVLDQLPEALSEEK